MVACSLIFILIIQGEPIDEEEAKRRRDEELKKPGAAQEQLEGIGLFTNPDDVGVQDAIVVI